MYFTRFQKNEFFIERNEEINLTAIDSTAVWIKKGPNK